MNTKTLVIGSAVVGITMAGVYYWRTKDKAETTQPEKRETTMSNTETNLDEMMLSSSKVMYQDVLASFTDKADQKEQLQQLMVQLIYAHLNARDCTNDVNRTYVDWLRKMHLSNPEHYEAIIRRCADEGISSLGPVREVVLTHRSGSMFITKQQHEIEVADLSNYTSLEDITSNKLDIPTDAYVLSVERILDIPVKVVLTGRQNVVTLKEAV